MGLLYFALALTKQLLDVVCGFWDETGQILDVSPVWQTHPNGCVNIPITLTLEGCIPVGLIFFSVLALFLGLVTVQCTHRTPKPV